VHPLLVLLAFTVAAVVTYAVVLGVLTAASVVRRDRSEGPVREDPALQHDDEHARQSR
jgi:hypothetical protein